MSDFDLRKFLAEQKAIKVKNQQKVEINNAETLSDRKLASILEDAVVDFDGKYLDNGDFKPEFVETAPANESLEELLANTNYSLEDVPTEWVKVNTYEGNAETKYDTDGYPLYHYEVEIYQFVKREGDTLMTAEAVSKPLKKVSDEY